MFGNLPLVRVFRFPHQVLAIREIASDFTAYHHRQLIDGELGRGSVVSPVVVVSAADSIQLIRMLFLDLFLTNTIAYLHINMEKQITFFQNMLVWVASFFFL